MSGPGRRSLLLVPLLVMAAGCFGDRPRPSPVEPEDSTLVGVQLVRPSQNSTVIAGRPVVVEVLARSEGGVSLSGVGFVARLVLGGGRIDSMTLQVTPRVLVRDSFQFVIPAQLSTNTHLSIRALAFPTSGVTRYSTETQVVVAQCTQDIPACR